MRAIIVICMTLAIYLFIYKLDTKADRLKAVTYSLAAMFCILVIVWPNNTVRAVSSTANLNTHVVAILPCRHVQHKSDLDRNCVTADASSYFGIACASHPEEYHSRIAFCQDCYTLEKARAYLRRSNSTYIE